MNRTLLSGLTATLLITALGATSGNAQKAPNSDQGSEANLEIASTKRSSTAIEPPRSSASPSQDSVKLGYQSSQNTPENTTRDSQTQPETVNPESLNSQTNPDTATSQSSTPSRESTQQASNLSEDVVKIGEQPTPTSAKTEAEVIAKVHPHILSGRKAATLYVHNIPVLTFTGSTQPATERVKIGSQNSQASTNDSATATVKSLSPTDSDDASAADSLAASQNSSDDPVWRASKIAATLNQLNRDGIDASKISVSWNQQPGQSSYSIKLDKTVLAVIDDQTILPDTTRNLEDDALQATNRLRRLLGNAAPLSSISGRPRASQTIALGPIRFKLTGFASWYGPGFHGNQSASGETFNQNALTAAHRTLPFGTKVLVTNLDNGLSVVVRINDRGPYCGDRIIDLSAGAARVLGLIQSGVAPVRLDLVNDQGTVVAGN